MTTKHTPGPWKIVPELDSNGMVDPKDAIAITSEGWDIAAVWRFVMDDQEERDAAEDNARLIAAAPETAEERDRLKSLNSELLGLLAKACASVEKQAECDTHGEWYYKAKALVSTEMS